MLFCFWCWTFDILKILNNFLQEFSSIVKWNILSLFRWRWSLGKIKEGSSPLGIHNWNSCFNLVVFVCLHSKGPISLGRPYDVTAWRHILTTNVKKAAFNHRMIYVRVMLLGKKWSSARIRRGLVTGIVILVEFCLFP